MIDLVLIIVAGAGILARLLNSADDGQNVVDKPGERIFNRKP